jgi:hypothetical protein
MSKEGISFPDLDGTNVRVGIIRTRYADLCESTQSITFNSNSETPLYASEHDQLQCWLAATLVPSCCSSVV